MSNASKLTTFVLRKLWASVAIILVVFAILMSAVRYSLPYINDQKHHIESYVKANYGVDLAIGNINAQWRSNGPQMVLENVTLPSSDASPVELTIQNINVEIDFWETLISRQFVSKNFDLNGLNLSVNLDQLEAAESEFPIVDALETLFLEQLKLFSVTESKLSLLTENTNESFEVETLSWLNRDGRHQGKGSLRISNIDNNSAFFLIDLYTQNNEVNGSLYANAKELDVSAWFNEFSGSTQKIKESRGNFELWGQIENKRLIKMNGNIKSSHVSIDTSTKEEEQELISGYIDSGTFIIKPFNGKWLFNVQDLNLSLLDETITTGLVGQYSQTDGAELQISDPFEINGFVQFFGKLFPNIDPHVSELSPQGLVDKAGIKFINGEVFGFASARNISWQAYRHIPGFAGLNLDVKLDNNEWLFNVNANAITLDSKNVFSGDVNLNYLDASILVSRDEDGFTISSQEVGLGLDDFDVQAGFRFDTNSELLSAFATLSEFETNRIENYLPESLIGQGATDFLSRAFQGEGKISKSSVIWHGNVNRFPFKNNDGIFAAQVDIEQSDFVFASDWPSIEKMDISLDFINNDLFMNARTGRLDNVELTNVKARIPVISSGRDLIIEATATATGHDLTQLMLNSSLKDSLGRTLSDDVVLEKDLIAQLSLYIPLDDPTSTSAGGLVFLEDNNVIVPSLDIKFDNVEGSVAFTNEHVRFSGLEADFIGQPIVVDYNSTMSENGYRLDLLIEGNWDVGQSLSVIDPQLSTLASGPLDWNASINVTLDNDKFDYAATVFSSLSNVTSSLPTPLLITPARPKPLRLDIRGNNMASNVSVNLDDSVTFEGVLPHRERQFSRAHLDLGGSDVFGLGLGFSISANLDNVDFSPWYEFANAFYKPAKSTERSLFPSPSRVYVQAEQLSIAHQSLSGVEITARKNENNWVVDLNADQSKAKITVYDQLTERGIEADVDFLRIDKLGKPGNKIAIDWDPQELPPIKVVCRLCEIEGNKLGEVNFDGYSNDDGFKLDRIRIANNHGEFRAEGQWYKRNDDHYTFLNGKFDSSDFGAFLTDYNFDSGIKDSEADVEFRLTWMSSPFEFEFSKLDGEFDWELSDGYLTELSDKGSRIFTLLSLESLVRKLSLDFRDVFAKGFFYDDMKGTVQITNGKADTRDTSIDGGAGEMNIYGYTDLASKELNYNVSFTPKVTGNLPVLVYFMVNPPTAIAALALDQMLTSTKVISNINYSVTGTLDNPILTETGRKSTDVALPSRSDVNEVDEEFVPPSMEDAIKVEINDS